MKDDSESSLELLLDTMCNTFGGVMFIAITLAIALFARNGSQSAADRQKAVEARKEALMAQLATLRRQLVSQAQEQKSLHETMLLLEKDPRLRELKRLAIIEMENQKNQQRLGLMQKELEITEKERQRLESKVRGIQVEQEQKLKELLLLAKRNEQNKEMLKALEDKLEKTVSPSMSFTILASHNDRASYFLLLRKGQVWEIGPNEKPDSNGLKLPKNAVTYTLQGMRVRCVPKPGCGVPALDGDKLSSELLALLQTIPPNRGALFCFATEDAAVFYRIRERLKQQGYFHGFNILPNTDSFVYVFSDKPQYEY